MTTDVTRAEAAWALVILHRFELQQARDRIVRLRRLYAATEDLCGRDPTSEDEDAAVSLAESEHQLALADCELHHDLDDNPMAGIYAETSR